MPALTLLFVMNILVEVWAILQKLLLIMIFVGVPPLDFGLAKFSVSINPLGFRKLVYLPTFYHKSPIHVPWYGNKIPTKPYRSYSFWISCATSWSEPENVKSYFFGKAWCFRRRFFLGAFQNRVWGSETVGP